jgi:hypothetical protein
MSGTTVWSLHPEASEPIRDPQSGDPCGAEVRCVEAARTSAGTLRPTVELWLDGATAPELAREVYIGKAASEEAAIAEMRPLVPAFAQATAALAATPGLCAADLAELEAEQGKAIRAAILLLALAVRHSEPRHPTQSGTPEQQSLEPPGFLALARDDQDNRVFLIHQPGGDPLVLDAVLGRYRDGVEAVHVPPRGYLPWPVPSAAGILSQIDEARRDEAAFGRALLNGLENFAASASDLGGPGAVLLMVLYVVASYLSEHFNYLPIIELVGPPARGKSRQAHAQRLVQFHGELHIGINEANLLRAATDRHASLILDLHDVEMNATQRGYLDALLARFEVGGQVTRVLSPDKGAFDDVTFFRMFGPTTILTNRPIPHVLGSRCLIIRPPRTDKRFRHRADPAMAAALVEKLYALRAIWYDRTLPDVESAASGRLGDVLTPLRQCLEICDPTRVAEFKALEEWQTPERDAELAATWDARLVEAVRALADSATCVESKGGSCRFLSLNAVVEKINEALPEKLWRNAHWTAQHARILGFTVRKVGKTHTTGLIWDDVLVGQLGDEYLQPEDGGGGDDVP